ADDGYSITSQAAVRGPQSAVRNPWFTGSRWFQRQPEAWISDFVGSHHGPGNCPEPDRRLRTANRGSYDPPDGLARRRRHWRRNHRLRGVAGTGAAGGGGADVRGADAW